MTNEIKKILDRLKYIVFNEIIDYGEELSLNECKLLLDYITNLQTIEQQYSAILSENAELENKITNLQQDNTMYAQLKDEYEEEIKDLQQENERLNKEINNKEFVFVGTAQNKTRDFIKNLIKEKNDYKSRCEKTIEYNNQIIKDTKDFYRPTTDIIYSGDSLIEIATNNINILQNGSEE